MTMKAMTQRRYGGPETLALREIDIPAPGKGELLVRVRASSVNAADWHIMRGDPWVARLMTPALGLTAPKAKVRGQDFAGEVIEGSAAGLAPGDAVFGDLGLAGGAFAEYAAVPADKAIAKPQCLTFEQAAALPLAGLTALIAVRDLGRVSAGERVLINGASGGVGTYATQIAKAREAEVTAVCSARNADLLRTLGADHVIDYAKEDFTRAGRYDVLLDLVGSRSLRDLRRALNPAGALLLAGGGVPRPGTGGTGVFGVMGVMVHGMAVARFARQRILVPQATATAEHLQALADLAVAGKLVPVIDRTYPLREVPDAIRYLEVEHARGKVVITVQ